MRVLFAGSPEIAVPSLLAVAAAHELAGVLTNPASAQGRGLCVARTPVAEAARGLGAPVLEPEALKAPEREAVAALRPDILVSFAYGRLFGPKFLALFPEGGLNVHPSLLPRWRGCAPIPYAILNRDAVTGVSVQRLAQRMDSGDVLARLELPLSGAETTGSLSAVAAEVGARLLVETLDALDAGAARAEPQDEAAATYSSMLSKDDGLLSWSESALALDARVRAFSPWPGAFTSLGGERLSVLEARPWPGEAGEGALPGTVLRVDKSGGILVQTGDGALAILRLQLRGKKAMAYKDFANGARGLAGSRLGETT